ncbi:hypothetical protein PoHVEF18_005224 [Penicillium ochrochloron]
MAAPSQKHSSNPSKNHPSVGPSGEVTCGGINSKPSCCNKESGLCQLFELLGDCGSDTMHCCNWTGNEGIQLNIATCFAGA